MDGDVGSWSFVMAGVVARFVIAIEDWKFWKLGTSLGGQGLVRAEALERAKTP